MKRVITMKLILSFHFNSLESKVTHGINLNRVISWLGVCTLTRNHINYKDKKKEDQTLKQLTWKHQNKKKSTKSNHYRPSFQNAHPELQQTAMQINRFHFRFQINASNTWSYPKSRAAHHMSPSGLIRTWATSRCISIYDFPKNSLEHTAF